MSKAEFVVLMALAIFWNVTECSVLFWYKFINVSHQPVAAT